MGRYAPFALILAALASAPARAETDDRTQYPAWLQDSFVELDVGFIDYPFSQAHMEPGNRTSGVDVPHLAGRVTLFGHRFNQYLSGQVSVMRPVWWVTYRDVNGTSESHTVWANTGSITARGTVPLGNRFSVFGEGGMGVVSRHGFEQNGTPAVDDANYVTTIWSTGLTYGLNRTWDLRASAVYVPASDEHRQPHTVMFAGGAVFNFRALPEATVRKNASSGAFFPSEVFQIGITSDALGTGVNRLFSDTVPVFWGGNVKIDRGAAFRYQRNAFHSATLVSLDWGIGLGLWRTKLTQTLVRSVSFYPVLRVTPIRTEFADVYVFYSAAGPTLLSRSRLDGLDTGTHFTFQDLMGAGAYLGRKREWSIEVSIGHFSNGNTFSQNPGIQIPLTFAVGFVF